MNKKSYKCTTEGYQVINRESLKREEEEEEKEKKGKKTPTFKNNNTPQLNLRTKRWQTIYEVSVTPVRSYINVLTSNQCTNSIVLD
uniref:Uncharacterized protein n=1 Tax=Schistosoma haematobium TaxID=6185 RepID=A0A095AEI4_SCHHA